MVLVAVMLLQEVEQGKGGVFEFEFPIWEERERKDKNALPTMLSDNFSNNQS